MVDELKIYRGDNIFINDDIQINQPKINDICDFGEERYLSIVSQLVLVPQNNYSIFILNEMGIDFTKVTDFELFILLRSAFSYKDTKFIIPNLDFSSTEPVLINKVTSKGTVLDTQELALSFNNGIILKEKNYQLMASNLRKLNRIQRPWFLTVGTESTKKRMIQSAKTEYEKSKDKKTSFKSMYVPLISALTLAGCSENIWDMKISRFFDLIERLQLREQSNHLYEGIYNGSVDFNKVKNDLNWIKEIEFNEFERKTNMLVEA
jgi:hypothetical protein